MNNLYKPCIYQKDIFNINYDKLLKDNIKIIIFDIDNTIASTNVKIPSLEVINLFNLLKNKGFILIIVTNSLPSRALKFGKILDVETYCFSCKPLQFNYRKILNNYNIESKYVAAIGDQLFTDIKGANKCKMVSILVDQISNKESIITKLNRIKEKKLIKRENVIVRGEYYE